MVYEGNGLLNEDMAMMSARKMVSSGFDYEYEIYRFEAARDEAGCSCRNSTPGASARPLLGLT